MVGTAHKVKLAIYKCGVAGIDNDENYTVNLKNKYDEDKQIKYTIWVITDGEVQTFHGFACDPFSRSCKKFSTTNSIGQFTNFRSSIQEKITDVRNLPEGVQEFLREKFGFNGTERYDEPLKAWVPDSVGDAWVGGANRNTMNTKTPVENKWTSTGRKVTLKDGPKVLYINPKFPGELRVRKMRKASNGRLSATYVRPR